MRRSKHEDTPNLTARLHQLEQLVAHTLVTPRPPLGDALVAPAMWPWELNHVVPGGGRVYVAATKGGPPFRSATWLAPARRAAS